MTRIRSTSLAYREGSSDKVYEVDLSEVAPGKFVVTFRYGRRGSNLREGSKTPIPVDRARADSIFDALVRAKISSGYRDTTAPAADRPATPAPPSGSADPAVRRAEAILARLRDFSRFKTRWRLSRVAWAAGMLRLREAEPMLLALLAAPARPESRPRWKLWGRSRGGTAKVPDTSLAYSLAWALGRCGSERSIPTLRGLVDGHPSPDVRRIALESLRLVLPPNERGRLAEEALDRLPAAVAEAVRRGPPEGVAEALRLAVDARANDLADAFLRLLPEMATKITVPRGQTREAVVREAMASPRTREALSRRVALDFEDGRDPINTLYFIDDARTRPAVLDALRSAPLDSNRFRAIRHAFKAAELRGDAEVFAALVHRFETTAPAPRVYTYRDTVYLFEVFPYPIAIPEDAPALVLTAYSAATRHALRKHAWHTLATLGKGDQPDYVALASAVLLTFSEDDAKSPRTTQTYRYENGWQNPPTVRRTHHDSFADYHVLNQILRANSPRLRPTRNLGVVLSETDAPPADPGALGTVSFEVRADGTVSDPDPEPGRTPPPEPPPDPREDAFPHLWDAAPDALVRLLLESRCGPVHAFAARALRDNRTACENLDLDVLSRLASSLYDPTARLAADLVIARFDPGNPDPRLILLLADSRIDSARERACEWALEHWPTLSRAPELVVGLASSPFADTRAFARDLLRETSYADAEARPIAARFVAVILAMGGDDDDRARDAAEALLATCRAVLRTIGEDVIRDLLAHPLPAARVLAGELILGHERFAADPPADIISALFASPHPEVRAVAVRILDGMGDEVLIYHPEILLALIRHPADDVREAIRPTVRRLAATDPAFGRHLGERLVDLILIPGAPEGLPSHTARVLRDDLRDYLDAIPAETVLRLLRSRSLPAQEVGGLLLPSNVDAEGLPLDELVRLASCDVLSVREAVWSILRNDPARLRSDPMTAARLADARWEDSRQVAFALLRDEFAAADWPIDALIALCDSVKPDVQRFGRELISRASRVEDGELLALRLGEHPDPTMQEFAGLFLEQFAPGDPESLDRLRFFCVAVLSLVNRGRIAKARVFGFLERVALADESSARVVAEVLARQSAGSEASYRGRMLALMVQIHDAYPAIDQPIRVLEPEIRHAL